MANPFQSLSNIPVMATVLDVMQRQANVERINAGTNYTNAETQLLTNQIQSQKQFNDALARLADAKQIQENTDQGVPVPFGNIGSSSMGKPIVDGYQRETAAAKNAFAIAEAAGNAHNYVEQQRYIKQAQDAEGRARQWYAEGLKLAQEQRKELSSIAGSYNPDGSNLPQVLDAIKEIDPKLLRGAQFNRDNDSNIIPGDRTTSAINSIANSQMTRSEQLAAQREAEKIKQDKIRDDRLDAAEKVKERNSNVNAARAQAAIEAMQPESVEAREFAREKGKLDAKASRAADVASKAASGVMIGSARAAILASKPGEKWDDTLSAYAADVADLANKIKADELKQGNDIDLGEARQQAIAALDQFVKPRTVATHWFGEDDKVSSYSRPKAGPKEKPKEEAAAKPTAYAAGSDSDTDKMGVGLIQAGLKDFKILKDGRVVAGDGGKVKVSNKQQRDALPPGTDYIGPDGKPWTKQ